MPTTGFLRHELRREVIDRRKAAVARGGAEVDRLERQTRVRRRAGDIAVIG